MKLAALAAVAVLALAGCGSSTPAVKSAVAPVASTPAVVPTEATPEATTEAAIVAAPGAESTDSCSYLLEPHYRFVGQSEITNTGNIDVKVEVVVTWKQVGAKAVTRTKYARVNVGQTSTVDFDVPASNSQIDQIQAYTGVDNCKVVASAVDVYGVAH